MADGFLILGLLSSISYYWAGDKGVGESIQHTTCTTQRIRNQRYSTTLERLYFTLIPPYLFLTAASPNCVTAERFEHTSRRTSHDLARKRNHNPNLSGRKGGLGRLKQEQEKNYRNIPSVIIYIYYILTKHHIPHIYPRRTTTTSVLSDIPEIEQSNTRET